MADQLAEYVQFFSSGTWVPSPPLVQGLGVDIGQLMRTAVEKAKPVRPDIKLGICGEHGGDPESVNFCHRIGLAYGSYSPFRVRIARLLVGSRALFVFRIRIPARNCSAWDGVDGRGGSSSVSLAM